MNEYRVVKASPGAARDFRVEVRDQSGAWKFARWAKTAADGKRIIAGIGLLSNAMRSVKR